MRYWLMKSEPDEFSIDDLAAAKSRTTPWFGVRNYQARNFMRDQMRLGDRAFFYHSSCPEPGIAGIVEVSALAYPGRDAVRQEEPALRSEVDARCASLGQRRREVRREDAARSRSPSCARIPSSRDMRVLQRGNRLSITPVDPGRVGCSSRSSLSASREGCGSGADRRLRRARRARRLPRGTARHRRRHDDGAAAHDRLQLHQALPRSTSCTSRWRRRPRRSCSRRSRRAAQHHRHGAVLWNVVAGMAPGIDRRIACRTARSSAACRRVAAGRRSSASSSAVAATQMLLDRKPKPTRELPGTAAACSAVGGGIGLVSSMVGAGGAFLTVPFLVACNVAPRNCVSRRRRRSIAGGDRRHHRLRHRRCAGDGLAAVVRSAMSTYRRCSRSSWAASSARRSERAPRTGWPVDAACGGILRMLLYSLARRVHVVEGVASV